MAISGADGALLCHLALKWLRRRVSELPAQLQSLHVRLQFFHKGKDAFPWHEPQQRFLLDKLPLGARIKKK